MKTMQTFNFTKLLMCKGGVYNNYITINTAVLWHLTQLLFSACCCYRDGSVAWQGWWTSALKALIPMCNLRFLEPATVRHLGKMWNGSVQIILNIYIFCLLICKGHIMGDLLSVYILMFYPKSYGVASRFYFTIIYDLRRRE